MESFRNFTRYPYLFAAGLSLLIFGGCKDDVLPSPSDDSRIIRFDVDSSDNSSSAMFYTRSENGSRYATLSLTGASSPLFLVPSVESTPTAQSQSQTRGTVVDASTIDSFGVFAGYSSEAGSASYKADYMKNVKVTRSSDWTPQEEYLWPGQDALHFNAYSPYIVSPTSEGITALASTSGTPQLSFKVPTEVTDQFDLLYSVPIDASSSPCSLTFNHALTGIRFVTGSELVPCTIKEISINGTKSSGNLNLETGEWADIENEADFIVTPNLSLAATEGGCFVESGIDITSSEGSFLLIPQTLDENAEISITFDFNGEETVLKSSLANQQFEEGKTITYRISANPEADSLILNVSGDFNTEYKGSSNTFTVKSSMSDDGNSVPVSWIAEFVDDNGNTIDQPNWITEFTLSGSGDAEGKLTTVLQDLKFEKMSASTTALQKASDINQTSGQNPYNLSSASGAANIETTANTYVVNAPGTYSIPLVYGNAIVNGSVNTQAYAPSTHNSRALKNFTNHLNNAITSAYIYENSDCTPKDAVLIWEDGMNLIRNVRLSDDAKNLVFDVPASSIRQGNALLAVRDSESQVMWSWQIWVTDYNPSSGFQNITAAGTTYALASQNLGYISGGDNVEFPEVSVKVRFTQTGLPESKEPLTKTITITQSGTTCTTNQYNPYYQWGRKDPMMSDDQNFYDASHNQITTLPSAYADTYSSGKNLMQAYILHPDTFFKGTHDSDEASANWSAYPYVNFWDGTYSTANPKTIYDPNPAGYVVPYTEPLIDFTPQSQNTPTDRYEYRLVTKDSSTEPAGFYVTVKSTGEVLYFPSLGYRTGTTAATASSGNYADYWLSHAIATLKTGGIVQFYTSTGSGPTAQQTTDPLFHGMSIRGVKE